jgi:light-regulated signal transduction histidine kinase (bacteriophytochrome)
MYKARNAAVQSMSNVQPRNDSSNQVNVDLELRVEVLSARLKTANQETEAFSCSVAHELRSPLQVMSNLCYLIHSPSQGELSEERMLMLDQVCNSVTTMAKMVDDLLELSHTTAGKMQIEQVDLSVLASSILKGLAETDPDRKVVTQVEPGLRVMADPALIKIVLQNLLRNAWKFTGQRDPAQIEFGCTHRLFGNVFHVRDNGAGFDPLSTDRLFKPFQRLHSVTTFPGIGIGLATIRRIIDRHGGEVWAEGEVGKGATFHFTLQSPEQ